MSVRRLRILACALGLAFGLAACGSKQSHPHVADAENNGFYVDAGPITYQLQVSRLLNPYGAEDSQYVKGLPVGTPAPTADQDWYGVFLWAKNQTSRPQTTTDNFSIVDSQHIRYYPIHLDPNVNPYAWTSQVLKPLGTQPGPDTTASFGPTGGGLVLFKINNSAFANRPLILEIRSPAGQVWATISLDL